MTARSLLLTAIAALALLSACSGDDEKTTPTATSTAMPAVTATGTRTATATVTSTTLATATATSTATTGATSSPVAREYTGLPSVDAIIAAVLSGDVDRVVALIQLRQVACGPQAGGGSPPPCPPGQSTGTPVSVFPVATCEGEWRSEGILRPSVQPLLSSPELYAIYGMPSQFQALMPDGEYVAVFSRSAQQGRLGAGVVIAGNRIVGIWYGCGAPVDQIVPAGTSTILPPGR